MPTTRQANPTRSLKTHRTTDRIVEAKPSQANPNTSPASTSTANTSTAKKYGRTNPDFAAMAGWRPGFGSPYHKAHIVRALRNTSALCPNCKFDLINQRRPDCPECHAVIDPETIIVQSAPPRPLMVRSLIAAVALSWIALIAGGFAWAGVFKAFGLTALFALQLACGWVLLTLYTDTTWYRSVSTPHRKLLLAGSVAAAFAATGAAAVAIAGLL